MNKYFTCKILSSVIFFALLMTTASFGQTITKTSNPATTTSVDNVGNYGTNVPDPLTFTQADFSNGCEVTDVNVSITWAKTDGSCASPGTANSYHNETSFRLEGPDGTQVILVQPGTYTGDATMSLITTTFDQSAGTVAGGATPVAGTFRPNNGSLNNFWGTSGIGTWTLQAGDNGSGDALCIDAWSITVTTAPDVTNPNVIAPADITINYNDDSSPVNTGMAPATDICNASTPTYSDVFTGGGCSTDATITRTWSSTDDYSNTGTAVQIITITGGGPTNASGGIAMANTCATCTIAEGQMNLLQNGAGEYIGRIEDIASGIALGSTTSCVEIDAAPTACAGTFHLQRNWEINVTNNEGANVILYTTDAEMNALATSAGYANVTAMLPDLNITAMNGGAEDCTGSTTQTLYTPTLTPNDPETGVWSISFATSGFSTFFLHPSPTALPVELLSFTGRNTGTINQLDWSSASEENVSHFEIEKSTDGQEFVTIGEVAAIGNSTEVQTYDFADTQPSHGFNYYRLNMVDNDGSFEYSNLIQISYNKDKKPLKIFPNPFKNELTIEYDSSSEGVASIGIYDLSGKLLLDRTISISQGASSHSLEVNGLAPGIYIARVLMPDTNELIHIRIVKN